MILRMSIPAILAQLSSILMQYIDASMVGQLGAASSASIGLVSSTIWLFSGLCSAFSVGFTVQAAQYIGAGNLRAARSISKQGIIVITLLGLLLGGIGMACSARLPVWLGGNPSLRHDAFCYFLVYAMSIPLIALYHFSAGMLQASGNMRTPSVIMVTMCVLDVIFNALLIFPTHSLGPLTLPGAGMGVAGAALGTLLAQGVASLAMLYHLMFRSSALLLRKGEPLRFCKLQLKTGMRIMLPVALEHIIMCSAQVASTHYVALLGTVPLAANSFAVTAESLCYMPGYGIQSAAVALIGQSVGAKRRDLTYRLGWTTVLVGMTAAACFGGVLYLTAPWIIGILSPDITVVSLATEVLRLELICQPLYAASLVATGVFRGAGNTIVPTCLNFTSMWLVRIPIIALLAPRLGLRGVWIAMTIELCLRGTLFLIRLWRKHWLPEHSLGKNEEL